MGKPRGTGVGPVEISWSSSLIAPRRWIRGEVALPSGRARFELDAQPKGLFRRDAWHGTLRVEGSQTVELSLDPSRVAVRVGGEELGAVVATGTLVDTRSRPIGALRRPGEAPKRGPALHGRSPVDQPYLLMLDGMALAEITPGAGGTAMRALRPLDGAARGWALAAGALESCGWSLLESPPAAAAARTTTADWSVERLGVLSTSITAHGGYKAWPGQAQVRASGVVTACGKLDGPPLAEFELLRRRLGLLGRDVSGRLQVRAPDLDLALELRKDWAFDVLESGAPAGHVDENGAMFDETGASVGRFERPTEIPMVTRLRVGPWSRTVHHDSRAPAYAVTIGDRIAAWVRLTRFPTAGPWQRRKDVPMLRLEPDCDARERRWARAVALHEVLCRSLAEQLEASARANRFD